MNDRNDPTRSRHGWSITVPAPTGDWQRTVVADSAESQPRSASVNGELGAILGGVTAVRRHVLQAEPAVLHLSAHPVGLSHGTATLHLAGPMEARAERVFGFVAGLCPKRVWNEDVGEFMETVAKLERAGKPRWRCWLSIAAGVFWVVVNAMREFQAARQGKRTG